VIVVLQIVQQKMSVKPVSVSSILPTLREPGNRPPDTNRYAALACNRSPSVNGRNPSPAVKRPNDGDLQPNSKEPRIEKAKVFYVMENVEKMLAKGRDDFDKVKKVLLSSPDIPPALREIIGGMVSGMVNVTDAVEALASIVVDTATNGPEIQVKNTGGKKGPA
jgi:hypothetical protein